ncbi:MAG: Type 1 glutamine amidotransferase-like domain-containing protein [Candidatus Saccharimonadales bacterium]
MKHLILAGGRPWSGQGEGKHWVEALFSHTAKDDIHVAYCLFAEEVSHWPEVLLTNQELITKHAGSHSVSFQTLEHDTFFDVSAWADVIVIVGGDPARLREALEQYGDLMQVWDGKTISGSSAGADIMVHKYIYLQNKAVQEGFGWIKANFIPHWQHSGWKDWSTKDWEWAAGELAGMPGGAPLLCVREGDFVEVAVQ